MENVTVEFLLQLIFGLVVTTPGATALIVVLVNILKMTPWVTDDMAPKVVNILTVLTALVLGLLVMFVPSFSLPGLDNTFASVAQVLTAFLPVLMILIKWLSPYFYKAVRGVPVIGYHFEK